MSCAPVLYVAPVGARRTWFRRGWEPTTFRAKSQPSNWNSMNHEELPIAHLCKHEKHAAMVDVEIWASKNGWMLDAAKNDQIMAVWIRLGWRMFQPAQHPMGTIQKHSWESQQLLLCMARCSRVHHFIFSSYNHTIISIWRIIQTSSRFSDLWQLLIHIFNIIQS